MTLQTLESPSTIRETFNREGFVIFRDLFTQDHVDLLRGHMDDFFKSVGIMPGDTDNVRILGCVRYNPFRWIYSYTPFIEALKVVMGDDFIFFPESSIMHSLYSCWHKDTTSLENMGHRIQLHKEYRIVQVAIYPQENTEKYGGGLSVIPRSHKMLDAQVKFIPLKQKDYCKCQNINIPDWRKSPSGAPYLIPNKAYDLVMFDCRLVHSGNSPKLQPILPENRKYMLSFACSANNVAAQIYLNCIKTRPEYNELIKWRWPAEILELSKEFGYKFATL